MCSSDLEFDKRHGPWSYDGPQLKIEFSRISRTRQGALTLVIDEKQGTLTTVAWCLSKRKDLGDATCDLRTREGTTLNYIAQVQIATGNSADDPILDWARSKKIDAVIWTALTSNFEKDTGQPFSVTAALTYIKTLTPEGKAKAAEYIWRAPDFVSTPLRIALQAEPWFQRQHS